MNARVEARIPGSLPRISGRISRLSRRWKAERVEFPLAVLGKLDPFDVETSAGSRRRGLSAG
jgi:hypothetical protein